MSHRKILFGLTLSVAMVGLTAAYAQNKPATPPAPGGAGGAAAAAKPTCKLHGKACCDPAIEAHLPKEAVFKACGESDATYLGQEAQRDTCKYFFKVEGQPEADTFVQVYAPQQKEVLHVAERSVLLVEEGRQGVHDRQGEVAQGGADGGELDRALPGRARATRSA